MPNTPSLWGMAWLILRGWVGCVSDGFSFGCEIVALLLLTGSVMEGSVFYSQRSMWLRQCLIPGAGWVSFEIVLYPMAFRGCCLDINGEFDPGSGRTLAACLTHASRTVKPFGVDQWRTGE